MLRFGSFDAFQVARRLHALSQRIDRFKEETAGADPIRPELLLTSFTAFARDMAAHRANTCTLKFLVLPDRVVTIERSRFRLRFGVSATSRLALRHSLRAWHEWTTGLQTDGDLQANAEKAAREVGDALQIDRALAGLPARVTALRFVPDDSLHGFPFSVLKVENQDPIERFAVSVHANDAEPVRRPPAASASALFVGVTASSGDLPALTRADEELAPFRAWAGQACVTELRGGRATRAAVLRALPSSTFAHITCHGIHVRNCPDETGLVLIPNTPEREILSIVDIASIRVDQLRHLVLSACWSADNFVLPGRWVVSFPQRFCLAGAETVVACLWEVEEAFSLAFLERT